MLPEDGEGIIVFKDGMYIALEFNLAEKGALKRALDKAIEELLNGQASSSPTK